MRKTLWFFVASLVISVSLGFTFTTALAQTVGEQKAQSRVEQEAARIYSTLPSLSMSDKRTLFKGSTPELKSELWKVHLKSYLSKSP